MTGFQGILLSLFLYINLFLQIHQITAQTSRGYDCTDENSTPAFRANLKTIVSSVSTNINTYGFYNSTAGDGVDQVNTIALCRGDVGVGLCTNCVKEAANSLTATHCPNKIEAIAWYDECMFRYSNNPILGIMSLSPVYFQENNHDASNVTLFRRELPSFAGSLVGPASIGSFRKFAAKKISNPKIYGFMQCTPDITPSDCRSCLNYIANDWAAGVYNRVGAKVFTPSCSFRYEIYPFLKIPSNQASLPPQ
jgi:hypothetical protein